MIDILIAGSLVLLAIAVSLRYRLKLETELLVAPVRALVQLGAVALVIHVVFDHLGLSGLFLVVMVAAATWTSGRRLKGIPRPFWLAGVSIAAATALALVVLFGAGVFELEPRFLIPIAGMLIGNAMIVTSLAGGRLRDELVGKSLEVEARLALGVPAREAVTSYIRSAASSGLIPIIDTTKTVGLIHLPGAFVGMMLGGASPVDAAKIQLIVLFMLLGAVAVAGITITLLVARAFIGEGERLVVPAALST